MPCHKAYNSTKARLPTKVGINLFISQFRVFVNYNSFPSLRNFISIPNKEIK